MTKWESEMHKSWNMQVEGFRDHVATDGSLLEKTGKWGACGWAVVQLGYNEEMEPLHVMYESMEAELEVQRTIMRAELTAFLCLLKKVIGPIGLHVDNEGIVDGLWRGRKENASNRKLEMSICGSRSGKNCTGWAHRTNKDKKERSHFESFVPEGNEKADELAKAGAMLDEGFIFGGSESKDRQGGVLI